MTQEKSIQARIQAGTPTLRFFWIAFYDEPFGKLKSIGFPQFDPHTGEERLFKHIDQSRLKSIGWFPFPLELAERVRKHETSTVFAVPSLLPAYLMHLSEGQRVIMLRRNFLQYGISKGATGLRETIYMLGWQQTLMVHNNGSPQELNIKSIAYIYEDGRVVITSDPEFGLATWMKTKEEIEHGNRT